MPQADHAGPTHVLDGLYAWLLAKAAKAADSLDPRAIFEPGRVDNRPRELRTYLPLSALERGEPAVIPAWLLGGHSWPQVRDWPSARDRSVKQYRVHFDDWVEAVREA